MLLDAWAFNSAQERYVAAVAATLAQHAPERVSELEPKPVGGGQSSRKDKSERWW